MLIVVVCFGRCIRFAINWVSERVKGKNPAAAFYSFVVLCLVYIRSLLSIETFFRESIKGFFSFFYHGHGFL